MRKVIMILIVMLFSCDSDKKGDIGTAIDDIPVVNDNQGSKDMEISADMSSVKDVIECPEISGPLKGIAEQCESDCECQPDLFCYDEAYTAPYKICTRECGGVGVGCPDADKNVFKCIQFSSKPKYFKDKYDIKTMTICMPYCLSVEDCKKYGSFYEYCPGKSGWTTWDGITLGPTTCQVKNMSPNN